MQRDLSVLLFSRAGFFFSPPTICSLRAASFGPGGRNRRVKSPRKARVVAPLLVAGMCLDAIAAHAQSASWLATPSTSDFNTTTNWSTGVVPTVTATFGTSTITSLTFSQDTGVGTLQFNAAAPSYTFTLVDFQLHVVTGIDNLSSHPPHFFIHTPPGSGGFGGLIFEGSATAANAVITNEALVDFFGTSTADHATITTVTVNGMDFASGGTAFFENSTAGNATLITDHFGATDFLERSKAGNATIITNDGGLTRFFDESTGGQATFVTNAGGGVDISGLATAGMTAGSIAGAGDYYLGSKNLKVGGNNTDTIVSGGIHDGTSPINNAQPGGSGGSLTKVGSGTLTLLGDNNYSGGTTIEAGVLEVGTLTSAAQDFPLCLPARMMSDLEPDRIHHH